MSAVHRCPSCKCPAYTAGPNGLPERECHQCGFVFTPTGDAPATLSRGGAASVPPHSQTSPGGARATASANDRTGREGTAGAAAAPSNPRACVLCANGLLMPGGELIDVDPRHGARVLELAHMAGLLQVWVGPAAGRVIGLPERLTPPTGRDAPAYGWSVPHAWTDAIATAWEPAVPGLAPWVGFRDRRDARPDVRRWVDVAFPHLDERNPFRQAGNALDLLDALGRFANTVGLRYRHSPGSTGMALMDTLDVFKGAAGQPPPPATRGLDADNVTPWVRPPADDGGFVHAYDVNGMYLAASAGELGLGVALHREGAPDEWRRAWPGFWHATIAPWDGPLPVPFKFDGRPHWFTTDALDLAYELGASVEISEAWVFPERRRALRPWYERLRDARSDLLASSEPAARLALDAVKAVYTQSLGWLGGRWRGADDPRWRPDWRAAIIARARANVFRHMHRVYLSTGAVPVLHGRSDLVAYWTAAQQPDDMARSLGLELSQQLGRWKHAGSMDARQLRKIAGDREGARAFNAVLDGAWGIAL